MTLTIIVATHLKYRMPGEPCYLPLQVGKAGKRAIGYEGDDTGDNISEKNPYYCELTGLYWMWKNIGDDYLGLVHYRRYLGRNSKEILTGDEIMDLMRETEILLPKKRHYYIEGLYEHYGHTHYAEHLDAVRRTIGERCPDYLPAFDLVMQRSSAHMFNMFVMTREKCDEYCTWLFDLLGALEEKVDVSHYDSFQARVFGRVGELMLDVWLEKNGYDYKEVPIVYTERRKTLMKVCYFLYSKIFHRKYRHSV